jgi:hypothetical protein
VAVLLVVAGIVTALVLQQRHLDDARAELQALAAEEAAAHSQLLAAKAEATEALGTEPKALQEPDLLDALQRQLDDTPDPTSTDLPSIGELSADEDFAHYGSELRDSIESAGDALRRLQEATDAVTASVVAKARSEIESAIDAGERVYSGSDGKLPDEATRVALRAALDAALEVSGDPDATAERLGAATTDVESATEAVQAALVPKFDSLVGVYEHSSGSWTISVDAKTAALAGCDDFCESEGAYVGITGRTWDGACFAVKGTLRLQGEPDYRGEPVRFRLCPKGYGGPGDDSRDRVLGQEGYLVGSDTFYRVS